MKIPEEEVDRLSKNPIFTKHGSISVLQNEKRPFVAIGLKSFPERPLGSLFLFSPEEWTRIVEVMRRYFARENK